MKKQLFPMIVTPLCLTFFVLTNCSAPEPPVPYGVIPNQYQISLPPNIMTVFACGQVITVRTQYAKAHGYKAPEL